MRYDKNNNSGFLILPSRRRLRDYKNYITPQRGFNKEINFSRDERAKMFIARPTYEGIKITVYSVIELTQYLINAGVPYVLTGKYIQDFLENYFSMQRATGRRKNNPSLYDIGYNDNTIRNAKSYNPIKTGNCEHDVDFEILNEKLPSKKAKR